MKPLKEFNVGDKVVCVEATAKSPTNSRYSTVKYVSDSVVVLQPENEKAEFSTVPYRVDMALWVEPNIELTTHDMGSRWKCKYGGEYILAQIGYAVYSFINLRDGNRYCAGMAGIDALNKFLNADKNFVRI